MTQPTVVVMGGINMDLVAVAPRFPEDGETVVGTRFLTYTGGKGANQAVAAARMGARVMMIGRVGDEPFGQQLLDSLQKAGVDVSGISVQPECSSGVATITIDASAQNRIVQVLGANSACDQSEVARTVQALKEAKEASVLMLQLEIPVEVSMSAARAAADMDRTVILDPGPARPLPEELYRCCDYLTPNETEAQALVGFPVVDPASAEQAARVLLERGARCAVIKMGALGAYYSTNEGGKYLPAFPVDAVDTVAAGDAFNGALAGALAEGRDLESSILRAMAGGALAVTRHGAQDSMPSREEAEDFLSRQRL